MILYGEAALSSSALLWVSFKAYPSTVTPAAAQKHREGGKTVLVVRKEPLGD